MNIKDSHDRSIRDLLGSYFFEVPRFQRAYAWDRENLQDFWNDTIAEGPADHFLGSMVVYEVDPKVPVYGIVDGQQRLTTAIMILCALRNAARRENLPSLADGIQNSLLERRDVDNKARFVLDATSSYPFLQEHILKNGQPETSGPVGSEQERLAAAFQLLSDRVSDALGAIKTPR